ncbi:hypothetical protein ABPG75_003151 [Micractinium tetrahymenae]
MAPSTAQLFGGLALLFVVLEGAACLGLTATISLSGILGGLISKRAPPNDKEDKAPAPTAAAPPRAVPAPPRPTSQPAPLVPAVQASQPPPPPAQQPAPLSPEPSAPAPASEPSAPAPASEPSLPSPPSAQPLLPAPLSEASAPQLSAERLPRPPASEPSAPGFPRSEPSAPSLAAQGSSLLPHEVSFTFCNALASGSSSDDGSGASGDGDGPALLGAVDERGEEDGSVDSFGTAGSAEVDESLLDEEEDCPGELVFEPSSAGVPGMRMLQHNISGLAERTMPTSADPGSPLLVSSYEARLVEVVNGRVKAQPVADPAYLSQPLEAAAHSPRRGSGRRSPSCRALGPLASCSSLGSLSPGPSSAAL